MKKGDKVYIIENNGYCNYYFIEDTDPDGITYLTQFPDTPSYNNPMNSKLFYGEKAKYFSTKEAALEHYIKKQNDKIQFAKDNL